MERGVSHRVFDVDFVLVQVQSLVDEGGLVLEHGVVEQVVARVLVFLSDREKLLLVDHFQQVDSLVLHYLGE
jgi:hypothetical protein